MEKEAKDLERKEETWELMKHTFLDEGSLHGNSRVRKRKKERERERGERKKERKREGKKLWKKKRRI